MQKIVMLSLGVILALILSGVTSAPCAEAQPPFQPPLDMHIILGRVTYEDDGLAYGANVSVINQETSEVIYGTVGLEGFEKAGYYQVDLSTLPHKYTDGDMITIRVTGTGNYTKWVGETTLSVDRGTTIIQWCNITLEVPVDWLPTFPRNPRATPGITGGLYWVYLQWMPPQDDGGSPITSYTIYRGDTLDGTSVYTNLSSGVTSFNDTGISWGITYFYHVTAVTARGEGPPSPLVKVSTRFPPIAYFTYSPPEPAPNESILLVDHSTDRENDIINWTWTFPTGTPRYGAQTTYIFPLPGTYPVNLTVTDTHGDTDTLSLSLLVQADAGGEGIPGFTGPLILLSLVLVTLFFRKKQCHP